MTKSTITRERIQRIIRAIDSEAYDEEEIREWLSSDEIMELSRMALAAMDSEPVEMPLDYLQGHKDGLEWAAQLAESNHPQTGDWLYDDPIELAKAIRKGQDMPPVQPVADSEPVAWRWRSGTDKRWHLASRGDLAGEVEPLYRHAQPAPERYKVRSEHAESVRDPFRFVRQAHAEWSDRQFGNVGQVGPLKHLAREAIEAAEAPDDISEFADILMLVWDATRRAGFSDEQLAEAVAEKLKRNKRRVWGEVKDGEPCHHVKN